MTEINLPKRDAEGFVEFLSKHPTLYVFAEIFSLNVDKNDPNEVNVRTNDYSFFNILINDQTEISLMNSGSLMIMTKLAGFILRRSGSVQITILYSLNK